MRRIRTASGKTRKERASGHAMVEVALMCPWILLLFIGIFDFGFYAYAAISVQNAARAAALATSSTPYASGSQTIACRYARDELKLMTNFSDLPADCSALPLRVVAQSIDLGGGQLESTVQVSYRTVQLFTAPFFPGQLTISRTTRMRVFGE